MSHVVKHKVAEHILERKLRTPVVAVSAYLDRFDEDAYKRCRIRGRISKPYRVREILDVVRSI